MSKARIVVSLVLGAVVAGASGPPGFGADPAADSLQDLLERAEGIQSPVPMVDGPGEPADAAAAFGGPSHTIGNRIATHDWVPPSVESLRWHGFHDTAMLQVGALWADPPGPIGVVQVCSGTVVARNLVLTAAHCLYHRDTAEWYGTVSFVPGQTWLDPLSLDPLDIQAPAGVWTARDFWVPEGYLDGSVLLDWGLIEIAPLDGRYIGDVVGSFPIQTGISFLDGARIWAAGYPGMGWWATSEGRLGRGQYSCDTTWHGSWRSEAGGVELWIRCPMNGGASGGPWLVQLNSGQWVIGGVNNMCNDTATHDDEPGTYCTPVSSDVRSLVFDARFLEFWNGVLPLLTPM